MLQVGYYMPLSLTSEHCLSSRKISAQEQRMTRMTPSLAKRSRPPLELPVSVSSFAVGLAGLVEYQSSSQSAELAATLVQAESQSTSPETFSSKCVNSF